MDTKQVIIIRKDLKMRRGKEVAQGSHASMAFLTRIIQEKLENPDYFVYLTEEMIEWITNSFTKICCYVNSEEELIDIYNKAQEAGLTVHLITDNGRTEFRGVPTHTCLAIGPHEVSKIDVITGHLQLL